MQITPATDAHGPPRLADVRARAAAELARWRRRLPASRPRLFFTAASWAALRPAHAASTGRRRDLFDAVVDEARRIAGRPAPAYRAPADVVAAEGMTPFDADQELWMRPVGNGMVALALGLALTGEPSLRAALRDAVLATCGYPQWGCPASHPNADLAAGHVARGIAVALDWHADLLDAGERAAVLRTLGERVNALVAAAHGGTFWAGHYDENHLHVSTCAIGLCGVAFLDEAADAPQWCALALSGFERVAAESSPDGSSPEGVPYWSYGMSFTLQFIEGTRHVLDAAPLYDAPYFRNSIDMRLHASTPDLAGIAPWGDAPPRDYYGPQHLLYRLAAEYRDGVGQHLADGVPFGPATSDDVAWTALWYDPSLAPTPPVDLDHHAAHAGLVASRSGWGKGDDLLCFKAGFTNRNHSHLDAGAIAFAQGGEWLLRTPGYGTGKGEPAFWDKAGGRWRYFSNATESHCTLLIDGRNQRHAFDARGRIDAYASTPDFARFGADLTGAYDGVRLVRRDVLHRRGAYVLIFDHVEADAPVAVEWLAQVPPGATVTPRRIRAVGTNGQLEVRTLFPAGGRFVARVPASPHADVPASHLRTFAVAHVGTSLRLATILIPSSVGQAAAVDDVVGDATGIRITCAGRVECVTLDARGAGPPRLRVSYPDDGDAVLFDDEDGTRRRARPSVGRPSVRA